MVDTEKDFNPIDIENRDLYIKSITFINDKLKYEMSEGNIYNINWVDDTIYSHETVEEYKLKEIDGKNIYLYIISQEITLEKI